MATSAGTHVRGWRRARRPVGSSPIKSFLVPSRVPARFLGNLTIPRSVTGATTRFNKLYASGHGLNATANRFILGGQMAAKDVVPRRGGQTV